VANRQNDCKLNREVQQGRQLWKVGSILFNYLENRKTFPVYLLAEFLSPATCSCDASRNACRSSCKVSVIFIQF